MKKTLLALVLALAVVAPAGAQVFTPDPPMTQFTLANALLSYQKLQNQIQQVQAQTTNLTRYGSGNWNDVQGQLTRLIGIYQSFPKQSSNPMILEMSQQLQADAARLTQLQARANGAAGNAQTLQVANELSSTVAGQLQRMQTLQLVKQAQHDAAVDAFTTRTSTNRL